MTDAERISVTRRIPAPPERIFAVITDPHRHVDIDGSGMLLASPDARPLREVGDSFLMNMDREPLGDIPLGKYQVRNTVTRIEPDALLEWAVGAPDRSPLGHVYGYELRPAGNGETEVTNYCDWSGLNEKLRGRITFPVVPKRALESSLENLAALVT